MNNKHRSKLRFNNRNLSFSDSSKTIKIYIIFSTPVIYQYTYLEIKFVHNTKSWFDKIYTIIISLWSVIIWPFILRDLMKVFL